MRVLIKIIKDTWHSYPSGEMEFEIEDDIITLRLNDSTNSGREISIKKEDFRMLCYALEPPKGWTPMNSMLAKGR
jgi:hypothetical protein